MKHVETCQCDSCIIARTKDKIAQRAANQATEAYLARRGGEPSRRDLQEALKNRNS